MYLKGRTERVTVRRPRHARERDTGRGRPAGGFSYFLPRAPRSHGRPSFACSTRLQGRLLRGDRNTQGNRVLLSPVLGKKLMSLYKQNATVRAGHTAALSIPAAPRTCLAGRVRWVTEPPSTSAQGRQLPACPPRRPSEQRQGPARHSRLRDSSSRGQMTGAHTELAGQGTHPT